MVTFTGTDSARAGYSVFFVLFFCGGPKLQRLVISAHEGDVTFSERGRRRAVIAHFDAHPDPFCHCRAVCVCPARALPHRMWRETQEVAERVSIHCVEHMFFCGNGHFLNTYNFS